jgi:hypothetical protein
MDSVIVLVLLGVIWAAVLIPPWLHSRRDAQPAASIRVFRRQLWRLGQGPVAGARRERYGAVRFVSDDGAVAYGPGGTPAWAVADDDLGHVRLAVDGHLDDGWADEYDDEYAYRDDDGDAYVGGGTRDRDLGYGAGPRTVFPAAVGAAGVAAASVGLALEPDWSSAGPQEPAGSAARRWAERFPQPVVPEPDRSPAAVRSRARAYRRRRQVMAVLVIAVVVTLAWALVLDVTALWVAQVVADVLLAGYVGLLIRLRRRTSERADKVHYLAPIEAPRPAVVVLHG